jgi:S1-C subfamily serine protease
VSFGTVPDFSWDGQGVRLEDVRPGTPAAQAGLRAGDIIVAVNEAAVTDMRSYSNALRQFSPGDEIRVHFSRDGSEQRIVTRVIER